MLKERKIEKLRQPEIVDAQNVNRVQCASSARERQGFWQYGLPPRYWNGQRLEENMAQIDPLKAAPTN